MVASSDETFWGISPRRAPTAVRGQCEESWTCVVVAESRKRANTQTRNNETTSLPIITLEGACALCARARVCVPCVCVRVFAFVFESASA